MLLNKVEKILRRAQATGAVMDVKRDGGRDVTGLRSEGIVRYGDFKRKHLHKTFYFIKSVLGGRTKWLLS